ncbi:hypothetical protein GEV839_20840 [Xanthomonas perforans]|uniref:Uncharacterized protein n=1 Tax=Xanthomonas perforans TaxID=442694 RepID=A0ABR5EM66_XANPE|nr:hypothetical protein XP315_20815 [Xanthomonas perforans]KLC15551.1 hypothetical protein XP56_17275 [Xanthomonas perforans]KLC55122.1 hypothetical protein XP1815_00060 [Xanthomonas perforans]KLC58552.1 hypothetical protein GEV839_20840 [Xanthomonas perforans]
MSERKSTRSGSAIGKHATTGALTPPSDHAPIGADGFDGGHGPPLDVLGLPPGPTSADSRGIRHCGLQGFALGHQQPGGQVVDYQQQLDFAHVGTP